MLVYAKTVKVDCGGPKKDFSDLEFDDVYEFTSHKRFGERNYKNRDNCKLKFQVCTFARS